MDAELLKNGLAARRSVLGDEYVDRAMNNAGEFGQKFQEVVSEYCWGLCWTDQTVSRRDRSILNLGMLAALGKMNEFETHFRGALTNGLTLNELRALLIQISVYCGVPVGIDCFRAARKVIDERSKAVT